MSSSGSTTKKIKKSNATVLTYLPFILVVIVLTVFRFPEHFDALIRIQNFTCDSHPDPDRQDQTRKLMKKIEIVVGRVADPVGSGPF